MVSSGWWWLNVNVNVNVNLIANLRLFLSNQSTLPWNYTTGAGSAAKYILDSDKRNSVEVLNPGD